MKLPTADRAKQISKKINEQQTKSNLEYLRKHLRDAIEEGKPYYRVSTDFCNIETLDLFVKEVEELGYKTKYDEKLIYSSLVNCLYIYWED